MAGEFCQRRDNDGRFCLLASEHGGYPCKFEPGIRARGMTREPDWRALAEQLAAALRGVPTAVCEYAYFDAPRDDVCDCAPCKLARGRSDVLAAFDAAKK